MEVIAGGLDAEAQLARIGMAGSMHELAGNLALGPQRLMEIARALCTDPALLLLEFPNFEDRGAFLVFFLVAVVATAQIVQEVASRKLRRRPVARQISRSFSYRAWLIGAIVAAFVGGLLYWITPFKAGQALVMAAIAGGAGTP